MSRVLKASYITIDNSVVIDNTFNPVTNKEEQILAEEQYIENEELEKNSNDIYNEKIEEELNELKRKIIEQANEEANLIIEEAKIKANIDANDIKRKAQEEMNIKAEVMYKEGLDKGYQEGVEKAENDCQAIRQEAQDILNNTKKEREDTINNLESEIINFILDTTKNILTNSFKFNPNIISLLIKKGLLSIKEIKNLKIFVSESNYSFVEENKQNILEIDTEKNNIEIIKDTSLKDTDCVIETEVGTIQCNIDEQLSSVKEALHYILN
ncbi:FliH/SctL family protein [uncultured Tyzzerella sp.]|uniref:FliH/SctL family protein n=1 Tax=uncultured Tyzzerella sp. TaxID=2321398 RepID=UPI002942B5D5|nr:FliH/SctL family protein [uncultured Tyzzerella sp.]